MITVNPLVPNIFLERNKKRHDDLNYKQCASVNMPPCLSSSLTSNESVIVANSGPVMDENIRFWLYQMAHNPYQDLRHTKLSSLTKLVFFKLSNVAAQ